MEKELDLVVIGGGPGGYVAAIRAAQLGMNVAVVEKEKLGGVCLHKGCIPTKTLLRSAELFAVAKDGEEFGLTFQGLELNFQRVQERKTKVIEQLYKGVQHLMKKGNIQVYHGIGRILGPSIFSPQAGAVSVEYPDGQSEILVPKHVIIATGSRPRSLPGLEIDGEFILTSDEALEMKELPRSVIIVGGGVIGIEWASMLSDFGVEVTVVEATDSILPAEDQEIGKEMARLLKKRKVRILTNTKVLPETISKEQGEVRVKVNHNGALEEISAEKMLVAVGRQANIEGIGLENTEIQVENGFIAVNPFGQTKEPHIYAIGDCTGGLQFAHVASWEGITAVEHMAGRDPVPLNERQVPKCTYSRPEVASIGMTEEQAKEKGYRYKAAKIQFRAIGKALVLGEYDGFAKIIMDEESRDILGIHMIGPHVTDLISEAGLAMVLNAVPWEIGKTIHPHPTLSEIFAEAAHLIEGEPIHG